MPNVDELLASKPSIVVEAASQQAVREYYNKILAANIDFIIMSTGALLDLNTNTPKLHFPSGAIGGLDALSPAALAGIDESNTDLTQKPQSPRKNQHPRRNRIRRLCRGSGKTVST